MLTRFARLAISTAAITSAVALCIAILVIGNFDVRHPSCVLIRGAAEA